MSRSFRARVDDGNIAYSAVTQPRPVPLRNEGTFSSTHAVHSTHVSPCFINTEPGACFVNFRTIST